MSAATLAPILPETGCRGMAQWTWGYILQQVIVLGAWCWLMRIAWQEIREVLKEGAEHKSRGFQMGIEHPQKTEGPVIFQDGKAARQ